MVGRTTFLKRESKRLEDRIQELELEIKSTFTELQNINDEIEENEMAINILKEHF
jgi:chromosome segregation ATPase